MGTVREKPDGGGWVVRWRTPAGQRQRTFRRKVDADRWLKRQEGDLVDGDWIDDRKAATTLKAWAETFLETQAHALRPTTIEVYRAALDDHLIPALGRYPLGALNAATIDQALARQLAKGYAPSSVHRRYRVLRRVLNVAVQKGMVARNPCDAVTPPRVPRAEMRFLTVDEVDRLADAIAPRYRSWLLVAAWGGLRWSETVGLRRLDVHGARITVGSQLVRLRTGAFVRQEPKTAAGRRTITVPSFVAEALEDTLRETTGPALDALVWTTRTGRPLVGSSFSSNVFAGALRRAGIVGRVRVHDLRHTAVALAVAAGAHPKAIQVRMGHGSISVTLDRYGHLFPEADEQVAADLGALRSGSTPRTLRAV